MFNDTVQKRIATILQALQGHKSYYFYNLCLHTFRTLNPLGDKSPRELSKHCKKLPPADFKNVETKLLKWRYVFWYNSRMKLANPFLTAGYAGPDYFCDRKRETEELIRHLDNDRNTTLISPRRYGKTGIIRHVLHLMSKRPGVKTVYVDLYPTRSLSDFARSLAAAVAESVGSSADKMFKAASVFARGFRPTMTIDEFSGRPKFSFDVNAANAQPSLEATLEYLRSRKGRTVVAIDEFQQIAEYPEKGVEALLRSKIQFMHNVGFVFSGSRLHMMAEMFHSPKRPFFNSTASMSLGVIDRQAYFRFAASFFRKAGRMLPEETFTATYERFEGITWYVQSVMKLLYAWEIPRPTAGDVAAAVGHLVEENAMNYGYILSKCTPGAVELLRAVAKDRVVSEPMSAEFGRRHGLRAASSVRFALDTLLRDELLYRREDGYVVYDRLFAEWLRT